MWVFDAPPPQAENKSRAARMTVAAAVAVLCAGAAGYTWTKRDPLRHDADTAMTTLHRSEKQKEREQAAVIVANHAISMIDALVAVAQRDDEEGRRARLLLDGIATRARASR